MGRPSKKINPICGQRLKTILKEQNVTQQQLSEKIHLSQVTISNIICGKASLTDETADAIKALFPQYRLQWLLGYDKYKTDDEINRSLLHISEREIAKENAFISGIAMIAARYNYDIKFTSNNMTVKPACSESKEFDKITAQEFLQDISDYFNDRLEKLYKRGH